jgi:hypothetical protein
VYGSAPGRKSTPRFDPPLALISSWISGSGSAAPQPGVDLDRDQLGHEHLRPPCELPDDHLGDERAQPLAGAAELGHVEAVVVGLDEAG